MDWVAITGVATGASAVVTSVTASFVAWQAYETRRTATASLAVLDANRRMAGEAIRARLDLRAPSLDVTAASTSGEVARSPAPLGMDQGSEWPPEREFIQDGDDSAELCLGAQFDVVNLGRDAAIVLIGGGSSIRVLRSATHQRLAEGSVRAVLPPASRLEFRLEKTMSLRAWVEAFRTYERGDLGGSTDHAWLECSDVYDEGVTDRWELELLALPISPKPNHLAAWTLRRPRADPPVVQSWVRPRIRAYYRSKAADLRIDGTP